jgi:hypothetical protein
VHHFGLFFSERGLRNSDPPLFHATLTSGMPAPHFTQRDRKKTCQLDRSGTPPDVTMGHAPCPKLQPTGQPITKAIEGAKCPQGRFSKAGRYIPRPRPEKRDTGLTKPVHDQPSKRQIQQVSLTVQQPCIHASNAASPTHPHRKPQTQPSKRHHKPESYWPTPV